MLVLLTVPALYTNSQCSLEQGAGGPCTWRTGQLYVAHAAGPFGPNVNASAGTNAQPNISAFGLQQTPLTANGYTVSKPAYNQQYNLDIQRELPWGLFADVAYAGAHGVHLQQYNTNVNQIPDSFIAQAASQYAAGDPVTIAQNSVRCTESYPFSTTLPAT